MSVETIQLKVNESSLIDKFRFAFTNKTTVLSELMQNARRAGASFVRFDYKEEGGILTVTDDGCGLGDFQDLLTIGESGWTEDMCREEQAFGVGFLSALYAAETISITSRGQHTRFAPKEIISKAMAQVVETEDSGLTIIVLEGIELPSEKLYTTLLSKAEGFPIEVFYDEESLPRPFALSTSRPFVETEVGSISLSGLHHGIIGKVPTSLRLYLQGLLIYSNDRLSGLNASIVHLDSTKFAARLPDRDCLVDEEEKVKEVKKLLKNFWSAALEKRLGQMDPLEFLKTYEETILCYNKDLLCQIPFLPLSALACIDGYPSMHEWNTFINNSYDRYISREEVEKGIVTLCDHPDTIYCDGENVEQWMYIAHSDLVLCAVSSLPKEHWAQPFIYELGDEPKNTINKPGKSGRFSGNLAGDRVTLCESYTIEFEGLPQVTIKDSAMYSFNEGYLIPGDIWGGEAVAQQVNYTDEWGSFNENEHDADESALQDFIRNLRCDDPAQVLLRLIQSNLDAGGYEDLKGKAFSLTFNEEGEPSVSLAA